MLALLREWFLGKLQQLQVKGSVVQTLDCTIQRIDGISIGKANCVIHWIEVYLTSGEQTFQPLNHANLEWSEKKPTKTWRLGPQTLRFTKYK